MTGHLIRRITKDEKTGRDQYGPFKPCPICGPPPGVIDLLGDYYDLLVERDELLEELEAQR